MEKQNEVWGWHATIHIYGEGELPPSKDQFAAAEEASRALDVEHSGSRKISFVGASIETILKQPKDQVAT